MEALRTRLQPMWFDKHGSAAVAFKYYYTHQVIRENLPVFGELKVYEHAGEFSIKFTVLPTRLGRVAVDKILFDNNSLRKLIATVNRLVKRMFS